MDNKSRNTDEFYREYAKPESLGKEIGKATAETLLKEIWNFATGWAINKLQR
jgi:predicted hydrocarbon binding protein